MDEAATPLGPAAMVAQPAEALDARYGYRAIRYNFNEREKNVLEQRTATHWPHSRPNSVMVCAMGNHWAPGSWQRVQEMVQYTNEFGYYVSFEEVMDRCKEPNDALGAMRNEAIFKAMQGFEYLCYIDTDVMPEKETLVRLLHRQMPVTAPMVHEPGTGKPLHGPGPEAGVVAYSGLKPMRWFVLSMMLWHTGIFRATGPEFWNDSIGADEGYHFQKLWAWGYRPYMDTDIQLQVANRPTYPLATNRMEDADAAAFWQSRKDWLNAPPDRRPIDPNDPRVDANTGEFMPFLDRPSAALAVPQGAQTPAVVGPPPPEVKSVLATDFFRRQAGG